MNNLNSTPVANQDIINFTPNTKSEVAIIAIPVLQRLAETLSATSLETIKRNMANDLSSNPEIDTMKKYLQFLQTEIDFHTTVIALIEYKAASEEPTFQTHCV